LPRSILAAFRASLRQSLALDCNASHFRYPFQGFALRLCQRGWTAYALHHHVVSKGGRRSWPTTGSTPGRTDTLRKPRRQIGRMVFNQ
jgi:hypothetical protein